MPIVINDLLRSSFRCIGQLRPGFGHSPSELADGLFVLNAMLDSWATDDLNAVSELIQPFEVVAGTAVYTVGPTGTWAGSRPNRLDKATFVVLTNPVQPLRLPLKLIDSDQFQSIHLQTTASTIPQKLFYNPTFPLATATLWPVPSQSARVELTSSFVLSGGFALGTEEFIAPPGYLDAIRYQLAVRLAMEWDKPLKDGVMMLATEALAKIQRLNAPTPQMTCNTGVMPIGSGRGGWSRLTGD